MAALAALVLVDRGELRLDDRVTRYWPEYGQRGKEATEVRQFLAHTAGVPTFAEPLSHADLYDWDRILGRVAGRAVRQQAESRVLGRQLRKPLAEDDRAQLPGTGRLDVVERVHGHRRPTIDTLALSQLPGLDQAGLTGEGGQFAVR